MSGHGLIRGMCPASDPIAWLRVLNGPRDCSQNREEEAEAFKLAGQDVNEDPGIEAPAVPRAVPSRLSGPSLDITAPVNDTGDSVLPPQSPRLPTSPGVMSPPSISSSRSSTSSALDFDRAVSLGAQESLGLLLDILSAEDQSATDQLVGFKFFRCDFAMLSLGVFALPFHQHHVFMTDTYPALFAPVGPAHPLLTPAHPSPVGLPVLVMSIDTNARPTLRPPICCITHPYPYVIISLLQTTTRWTQGR